VEWLNRRQLPFIAALTLGAICLTLYVWHLQRTWGPILHGQSLLAPRVAPPIAQDFALHWTGSFLALAGEPASVYDYSRFGRVEQELTGIGPHPWPYPPTGLLIDLPLALLPYFVSLAAWLTVTMGLYLLVLYRIAPHPLTIFWALAFFGTFENFFFGQNGFLSAALLGGGLLLLNGFPLVGGMCLGLVSYKPHLAALIPLALLAGRRWRALGGAVASGAILALASAAFFGWDIWWIFLKNISGTLNNLYTRAGWFYKMPSVFAAARLAGFDVPGAWIFHGAAMLAAAALVVWIWSRPASTAIRSSALATAILLFSPHIWYYDLTVLALALAWLWREGCTKGWLPGEQLLLLLSWLMPLASFCLAAGMQWSQGPLYLALPMIMVVRRYSWEKRQAGEMRAVTLADNLSMANPR
jgi:hypothetical protein